MKGQARGIYGCRLIFRSATMKRAHRGHRNYGGYKVLQVYYNHRQIYLTQCFTPSSPPGGSNFRWSVEQVPNSLNTT